VAQPTLTPRDFAQKWRDNTQKESSTSREHFIDLCRMLGEPTPNEADPTGTTYAFEKAVTKASGGDGFADVWKRTSSAGSTRQGQGPQGRLHPAARSDGWDETPV